MGSPVQVEIERLLKNVWPQIPEDDERVLVDHIHTLGVTCSQDMRYFTEELWPTTVNIPIIKKKQILAAFQNTCPDPQPQPPSSCPVAASQASTSRYRAATLSLRQRRQFGSAEYWYDIPWTLMPNDVTLALQEAKNSASNVHPDLILKLKTAIRSKLVADYKAWRGTRSEAQKHPGRRVYNDIGFQIQDKYGEVVKSLVGLPGSGKGTSFFSKRLEQSVENNMKSDDSASRKRKAVKMKETAVGIIADQYNPGLDNEETTDQQVKMAELQNLFELGTPWEQVRERMEETYELQRCHILEAKEKAEIQEKKRKEDNAAASEDDLVVWRTTSEEVKDMWPYLFTSEGLKLHHQRLTGRNLEQSLHVFCQEELERLLQFLITSTSTTTNVDNLIVKLKAQRETPYSATEKMKRSIKLFSLLDMLGNFFKEDINKLVIPVEKTSQPGLFKYSILQKIDPAPCIVALDVNKFAAKKFYVCADKSVLVETDDAADAIIAFFNLCFSLHLEYPAMKLTLEFTERFVLGMPISSTNIKAKNGSQIIVNSNSVKNLIMYFEAFRDIVSKRL